MSAKLFTGRNIKVVDRSNTMYFQALLHTLNHTIDVLQRRVKRMKRLHKIDMSEFDRKCESCRTENDPVRRAQLTVQTDEKCFNCHTRQAAYDKSCVFDDKMFSIGRVLERYRRMRTETKTDALCLGGKNK